MTAYRMRINPERLEKIRVAREARRQALDRHQDWIKRLPGDVQTGIGRALFEAAFWSVATYNRKDRP